MGNASTPPPRAEGEQQHGSEEKMKGMTVIPAGLEVGTAVLRYGIPPLIPGKTAHWVPRRDKSSVECPRSQTAAAFAERESSGSQHVG